MDRRTAGVTGIRLVESDGGCTGIGLAVCVDDVEVDDMVFDADGPGCRDFPIGWGYQRHISHVTRSMNYSIRSAHSLQRLLTLVPRERKVLTRLEPPIVPTKKVEGPAGPYFLGLGKRLAR